MPELRTRYLEIKQAIEAMDLDEVEFSLAKTTYNKQPVFYPMLLTRRQALLAEKNG